MFAPATASAKGGRGKVAEQQCLRQVPAKSYPAIVNKDAGVPALTNFLVPVDFTARKDAGG
jgi:hypothetical protein